MTRAQKTELKTLKLSEGEKHIYVHFKRARIKKGKLNK